MRRCVTYLALSAIVATCLCLGGGARADGKELRVGLVLETTSVGPTGDPFGYGALVGLREAVRKLGVEGKPVAPSPTGLVTGRVTYLPAISYLARRHYDLIIALGYLEAPDLAVAARRFTGRRFAILDERWGALANKPANVVGTWFKTEQAGYLAGYLAALMERRRPGRHVISSVGGYSVPQVNAYIAGYQAGAKKADPRVVTLNAYANDYVNRAKCERVALNQIAMGSGVVFDVAGTCGLGALAAAKQKGVWGIGVDTDQSYAGSFILTSAVKRFDVAVYGLARSLTQGTLRTGGDLVFDLRNGGVGLGKISPRVPHSYIRMLAHVRAQILSGRIRVPATLR